MVFVFKQGDLVWVRGTLIRPGKVLPPVEPNTTMCEPQQYVYFFGSHDYEWVNESELIPHSEEMIQQAETMSKDTILQLALQELKFEIAKQKVEDSLKRPLEESPVASKLLLKPSCSNSNLQVNTVFTELKSKRKKQRLLSSSPQNDYSSQPSTSNNTLKFEERRDPEEVTEKFENIDKDNLNTDQDNSYPFSNFVMLNDDDIRNVSETLPHKIFSSPPIPSKNCAGTSLLSPTNQLDEENDQDASHNTSTTSKMSTSDSVETSLDKLQSCTNLLHDQTVIDSTASTSQDDSHDSEEFDPSLNKSQPSNLLLDVSESPAAPKNLQANVKLSNNNFISTDSNDKSCCEKHASSSLGTPSDCESVVEELANSSDGDSSVPNSSDGDSSVPNSSDGEQQIRDVAKAIDSYNEHGPESTRATKKEIGFLGIGKMGSVIVRNLLNTGHFITVWNRSPEKYQQFLDDAVDIADSPCEVIKRCDIIFCCLSDGNAVKEVVEGENGVLEGFNRCRNNKTVKGFVQMTTLHPSISEKHSKSISKLGGQYLEVIMVGSKQLLQELKLHLFCAGNISLFKACETCFSSISCEATLSCVNVGRACAMKTTSSMMTSNINEAVQVATSKIMQKNIPMSLFMEYLSEGPLKAMKNKTIALLNNEPDDEFKSRQRELLIATALKNESNPIAASDKVDGNKEDQTELI